MNIIVHPTRKLEGSIFIPSSKSQSVRALIVATLAHGTSQLHHVLRAQDTEDAIRMCRNFGAKIEVREPACHEYCLTVESSGVPLQNSLATSKSFFSGNSGITTLFTMPMFGLRLKADELALLDCGEQMKKRPVQPLIQALRQLGLTIAGEQFPFSFSGILEGGRVEVDGTNSQYISALLLAAPYAHKSLEIIVKNLQERPYVEMTLQWLRRHHLHYEHHQENTQDIFYVKAGQAFQPFDLIIPGDFSSASYFLAVGALLEGSIQLQGLDPDDPQGDKKLVSILQEMGADLKVRAKSITVRGGLPLKGISIDASDIPDLVPTLAVLGTQAEGQTEIRNVAHARIKETDRLRSMTLELRKMGAHIEEKNDGLIVHKSQLQGASLHGHHDHRTIMALTVAGFLAEGKTEIDTAEAINKTFPQFIALLQSLGARIDHPPSHLVLIGFKNVGKSTIGRALAQKLKRPFIDLDAKIIEEHTWKNGEVLNCRELMTKYGEEHFRQLEHEVLKKILQEKEPSVLALGGGTPMLIANRHLLQKEMVVHISAPRSMVFERIMAKGKPTFFPPAKDALTSFQKLWDERENVFQELAKITIDNNGSLEEAVQAILAHRSSLHL